MVINDSRGQKIIRVCNVDEEGRFGGPEKRIVQISKALINLGVKTTIVYPKLNSEKFKSYIGENQVHSARIDITRLTKEKSVLLRYILRFPYEIFLLVIYFRKHRFDIIHINGAYQFKIAIAARLSNAAVVWHLNDMNTHHGVKLIFIILQRFCANGFIVAGEGVKGYYLSGVETHSRPIAKIHAPVNLEVFDPKKFSNKSAKKEFNLNIGTVSGINSVKGVEFFLDVASRILKKHPNIEFKIAGSILKSHESYYQMLLGRINDFGIKHAIEFSGFIDDVPKFLSNLDICIFTSIYEASPTAVWEALAMGKVVISTDVGSVLEFIQNGVSGFVVPVGDTKSIVDKVFELIDNPSMRNCISVEARKLAEKSFGIESAARLHKNIYLEVLHA